MVTPFVRATAIDDISLYWLPVSRFPMRSDQRDWLAALSARLAEHMQSTGKLREELFLRSKVLYPDLVDPFTRNSMQFRPITGGGIAPGGSLPPPLDMDSLKREVDKAVKEGGLVDVQQWMPDMVYWFAAKRHSEQRQHFLGYGGMISIYLPPEPGAPPMPAVPRFMRTAPGFKDMGGDQMEAEMQFAYSLRDPFLKKSKAMFGEPYKTDPSYEAILFVLPLFSTQTLLQADPEQRAEWFTLFDGYLAESIDDSGVLLALKNPDFDEELSQVLELVSQSLPAYRD